MRKKKKPSIEVSGIVFYANPCCFSADYLAIGEVRDNFLAEGALRELAEYHIEKMSVLRKSGYEAEDCKKCEDAFLIQDKKFTCRFCCLFREVAVLNEIVLYLDQV